MKHLFLSSRDSLDNHPNNFPYDFTIDLQETLHLDGYWECALREIKINPQNLQEECYLFTDVVSDSYVLDNHLPILRQISTSVEFINSYYHKVNRKEISRIRLYIRNENLQFPSSSIESVNCVLSFRKRQ